MTVAMLFPFLVHSHKICPKIIRKREGSEPRRFNFHSLPLAVGQISITFTIIKLFSRLCEQKKKTTTCYDLRLILLLIGDSYHLSSVAVTC